MNEVRRIAKSNQSYLMLPNSLGFHPLHTKEDECLMQQGAGTVGILSEISSVQNIWKEKVVQSDIKIKWNKGKEIYPLSL